MLANMCVGDSLAEHGLVCVGSPVSCNMNVNVDAFKIGFVPRILLQLSVHLVAFTRSQQSRSQMTYHRAGQQSFLKSHEVCLDFFLTEPSQNFIGESRHFGFDRS